MDCERSATIPYVPPYMAFQGVAVAVNELLSHPVMRTLWCVIFAIQLSSKRPKLFSTAVSILICSLLTWSVIHEIFLWFISVAEIFWNQFTALLQFKSLRFVCFNIPTNSPRLGDTYIHSLIRLFSSWQAIPSNPTDSYCREISKNLPVSC